MFPRADSDVLCLPLSQPISCRSLASRSRSLGVRPGDLSQPPHCFPARDECGDDAHGAEGAGHTGAAPVPAHSWVRLCPVSLVFCSQLRDFLQQQLGQIEAHQALGVVKAVIRHALQAAVSSNQKQGARRRLDLAL